MHRSKLLHLIVVLSMLLTLVAGATAPALAQSLPPQQPDGNAVDAANKLFLPDISSQSAAAQNDMSNMPGMQMPPAQQQGGDQMGDMPPGQMPSSQEMLQMMRELPGKRKQAAEHNKALGLKVGETSQMAAAAAMPGGVPDYFGSTPNYALSPLPTVSGAVISVGNPLVDRAFASDYPTLINGLAPVLVVLPQALPLGQLQSFQTWNQVTPGGSPFASAGQSFHAYVLRPTTVANQYTVIYDSGLLTVPTSTGGSSEAATFPIAPAVNVQAGDKIGFIGAGVPVDTASGSDVVVYPAGAVPALNDTINVGDATYPLLGGTRTYSFAAQVVDLSGANTTITGGIRKFVDSLPGLGEANQNDLGQYIPVATPDTTSYPATAAAPAADYYEIGLIQYKEQLHKDLPPTTLRGYVQLSNDFILGKQIALTYPDGSPILLPSGKQAKAVDKPSYLGPIIVAQRDRPVRVKFYNLLPKGQAGNLFIPVDTTVMGSGMGPGMAGMAEPDPQNPMCGMTPKPAGCYTEDRGTIHLHGGNTPWISDGTQHQWITPVGTNPTYPKGVSVQNVPDMDGGNEPQGVQTFYYTNQQSARLLFYHDHAYGITRLNVYAGEAAGYIIRDPSEQNLISTGVIPADELPLIIQDKTFVPDATQLATQDPTWDPNRWGGFGQLWYPHVYMPNQNPYDMSGANAMGRWDYGPWFWPPFTGIGNGEIANPYYDPANAPWEPPKVPGTPNPSLVPEGFMDTPLVNGTAYPYVTVQPKAYRLRILNAANDRYWNLSLFKAASNNSMWDANGKLVDANAGEVPMVNFDSSYVGGFPADWGKADAREGGVPDPKAVGPNMIQIGTEAGFLPTPYTVPNRPINYNYNKRDITVLNVQEKALFLGPAERADVVVDFSQFAGQTLILYNDSPAPVPAGDPRLDYYTGMPNMTDTGGSPGTLPGYGPNMRTIMQIRVAAAAPAPAYNVTALQNALPAAYAAQHPKPIIPQAVYNTAFGANYPADPYIRIQATTTTLPNGTLANLVLTNPGTGYTSAPTVSFTGGGGTGAAATVTMASPGVQSVTVSNGGSGYTAAPTVSLTGGGGTGATATAVLATGGSIKQINVNNGGSNYPTTANAVRVNITGGGGSGAAATATVGTSGANRGRITSITVTNGGSGYTSQPTISFTAATGSGASATPVRGFAVASVTVTNAGANYTSAPAVGFSGGGGTGAAATAALAPARITGITLTNAGSGYSSVPTVTLAGGGGTGATASVALGSVVMGLQPKSIIENFDPDYGRMNAMLGVEVPNTTGMNQTSIPYTDIDPATEMMKALRPGENATPIGTGADGTQVWKITHNGVDTHALHWHMFDVQVINRVGWDGAVRAPDANEIGWKDTVRMNPLEDIIVAMRPIIPNVPWELPNSIRLLDPSMPAGSTMRFQNVDPTNQPAAVTNQLVNFGWEYVWHCHLLGHEENIMMRPMVIGVTPLLPGTPTATVNTPARGNVTLTWQDNSANETGFTIQRATVTGTTVGPWTTIGTAAGVNGMGSTVRYVDTSTARRTSYVYRVIANNVLGYLQTYTTPAVGYPHMSMDSAATAQSNSVTTP